MTSEILIMNKRCIVLAADSASTVWKREKGPKIFSADKIFALSRTQPVGIMTYNYSDISGMPVDVIVKEFRSKLGDTSFPSLEEYAHNFFEFINSQRLINEEDDEVVPLIYEDLADEKIFHMILALWEEACVLAGDIYASVVDDLLENSSVNKKKLDEVSDEAIKTVIKEMLSKCTTNFKSKESRSMAKKISEILSDEFIDCLDSRGQSFRIKDHVKSVVKILINRIITLKGMGDQFTGLVFAGYGDEEIFPSFIEYKIYGYVFGKLRYEEVGRGEVDSSDPSFIVPFAQRDVAETFLYGISKKLKRKILEGFKNALDDATGTILEDLNADDSHKESIEQYNEGLIDKLRADLDDYLEEKYLEPTEMIVRFLSKDEMASMAESLVNITSLKRRVSNDEETVGGPVDVAVISLGEGFIWIKRKHYFNRELNPYYVDAQLGG